jgi:hypothetical protein
MILVVCFNTARIPAVLVCCAITLLHCQLGKAKRTLDNPPTGTGIWIDESIKLDSLIQMTMETECDTSNQGKCRACVRYWTRCCKLKYSATLQCQVTHGCEPSSTHSLLGMLLLPPIRDGADNKDDLI